MTQAEGDRLDRIEAQLENVVASLEHLSTNVERLTADVDDLKKEVTKTNERVEIYQRASGQVVNLAFSLILAATAAIVIPAVLNR